MNIVRDILRYRVVDAVTGLVYGERTERADAERLARKYPGAVVRVNGTETDG